MCCAGGAFQNPPSEWLKKHYAHLLFLPVVIYPMRPPRSPACSSCSSWLRPPAARRIRRRVPSPGASRLTCWAATMGTTTTISGLRWAAHRRRATHQAAPTTRFFAAVFGAMAFAQQRMSPMQTASQAKMPAAIVAVARICNRLHPKLPTQSASNPPAGEMRLSTAVVVGR